MPDIFFQRMCILHFHPNDVTTSLRLRTDAVPSIFPEKKFVLKLIISLINIAIAKISFTVFDCRTKIIKVESQHKNTRAETSFCIKCINRDVELQAAKEKLHKAEEKYRSKLIVNKSLRKTLRDLQKTQDLVDCDECIDVSDAQVLPNHHIKTYSDEQPEIYELMEVEMLDEDDAINAIDEKGAPKVNNSDETTVDNQTNIMQPERKLPHSHHKKILFAC